MKKFCFIATVPMAINVFLKDIVEALAINNEVTIVSSMTGSEVLTKLNARFYGISIARKPAIFKDLYSFYKLYTFFRHEQFDLIHSIMPKSGLLSMVAGFLAGTPVRIHTFTGQVWCNKTGFQRWFLKFIDKTIIAFSTHILVDSPSQRKFLINERVLKEDQGVVIGKGSICGVDTEKFSYNKNVGSSIRRELGLKNWQDDDDDILLLFMGRLTKDKGIIELVKVFNEIVSIRKNIYLLVIGYEEDVSVNELKILVDNFKSNLLFIDYTDAPSSYLSAADIFCLPSYREGFGQAIIEASSCELPVVSSSIYGVIDAVEDKVSGLLQPVGDTKLLKDALILLIDNKELRKKMGRSGRERAINCFDKNLITSDLLAFYDQIFY